MKRLLTNYRLLFLYIALILTIFAINPNTHRNGVLIVSAEAPSPSEIKGQTLIAINGITINNISDYNSIVSQINPEDIVILTTVEQSKPFIYKTNEQYPFKAGEKDNETYLGLRVGETKVSDLSFGLELSGGTKMILQPRETLETYALDNVVDILRQRLDLFGVKGASVSTITDLTGAKYIQVELAGVSSDEARELLEKEGKFEAKIRNETVFTGLDIRDVCISGSQCTMMIEPVQYSQDKVAWKFVFSIVITESAAQKFANVTSQIETIAEEYEDYLNATIDFYIDDEIIEGASLRIPADLKGQVLTEASITGQRETQEEAQSEMRFLQSILQSRKLPVKMDILNIKTVSPTMGQQFINNIFILFIISIMLVDIIIAIRYKDPKLVAITIFVSLSEILITLGIASFINWNLDIASIAGILASVGTGITDQIVILDEVNRKDDEKVKKRISKAFFIVIAAFTVSIASMIPLLFAGAGLLRGFAVTTIIGLCTGVLITRPAFAEFVKMVKKD